jgi:hypothetical protein
MELCQSPEAVSFEFTTTITPIVVVLCSLRHVQLVLYCAQAVTVPMNKSAYPAPPYRRGGGEIGVFAVSSVD